MNTEAHLWAVGFDNMERAEQVRDEIANLGWGSGRSGMFLILEDCAVVIRHPDGSFTLNRTRFPSLTNILGCTGAGLLAGLVLAAPLTGVTLGALLGCAGTAAGTHLGISEDFIRDTEALMKPGTSALFVLDDDGDLEIIVRKIQGLGGVVLKTNVDPERAKLIQSTLANGHPNQPGPVN
jgi:uncharacterized membrane protein